MAATWTVYKTRSFARWARKEGLTDAALWDAAGEMVSGLYEANLGGGLLKKRIEETGCDIIDYASLCAWQSTESR